MKYVSLVSHKLLQPKYRNENDGSSDQAREFLFFVWSKQKYIYINTHTHTWCIYNAQIPIHLWYWGVYRQRSWWRWDDANIVHVRVFFIWHIFILISWPHVDLKALLLFTDGRNQRSFHIWNQTWTVINANTEKVKMSWVLFVTMTLIHWILLFKPSLPLNHQTLERIIR